jgi:hypothetical protein
MKTLILFTFFAALFYYLKPSDKPVVVDLDEIRVKVSAPRRDHSPVAHRHITRTPGQVEAGKDSVSKVASKLIETNTDIEESWEKQLEARLLELDPVAGKEIFDNYQEEKAGYALRLENLVKAHQESTELEFLIDELDLAHQQKLQDIFGPYFEELRDLQAPIGQ